LQKTTEGVVLVTRVLGHASHGVGVEHLEEERPDTADEHGRQIAVDHPRHAIDVAIRLPRIAAAWWWRGVESGRPTNLGVSALTKVSDVPGVPRRHGNLLKLCVALYVVPLSIRPVVCDTGEMAQPAPLRVASTESDVESEVSVLTERPWNVIVWDDPVTPMTVVVVIFRRIFGYSSNKCTHLMLTVHNEGRAIVWSGQRERAESYCVKLQVAGLHASVELDA
jgi:ATP-dependent Clp protease adaptor protein ClpS